ncbi:UDP-N-acetylglucosamine 2-epimerase [Ferribacterium limneticum]|uniref:UDP-N-acetylglucosamine 2-epimerase n=1 Tax=Ferribacterium limneticum TaxID=76259 RepID=UPI001CFAEF8E|nr:UDP-N-acetylglucosamine 2-epimerase [Ferribacterium limneticum]UCV28970.1 UDP-N-acetylglucosamine 2-epimerase (hydrolyzing) [Ferribacterium limneticum]UCV32888.1 UDP-N-acetylglucosamine 2-epimerase (hydrolyzing) [Ferribacterium limneticum]
MRLRTIAIFTGNRAEYGLQYPILRAVDNHPDLDYRLIVSGAHLDANFGRTLEEIRSDGFRIDAEVKIEMDAGSLFSTAQAIGSGIIEISKVLAELKPDMMVVYADRFEGLAAVIASSQMNIPTAHIEGGDLTEGGALDDSVRHAMTKLSHLHFTTNQQATNRILGMGEEAWRVHTVGFPAIDLISEGRYAHPDEIAERLGLNLFRPVVLFTQHSVTTEFDQAVSQLEPSLAALEELATDGVQVILTYPNNDAGGRQIIERLEEFRHRKVANTQVHRSLGRHLYHGVLALAKHDSILVACVGNSSSGLKETPAFGCPTVNIGSRQEGRLRGMNVVDAGYDRQEISSAIRRCLFDDGFRQQCHKVENPYWLGDAGPKIAEVLAEVALDQNLIRKKMTLKGEIRDGWFR